MTAVSIAVASIGSVSELQEWLDNNPTKVIRYLINTDSHWYIIYE